MNQSMTPNSRLKALKWSAALLVIGGFMLGSYQLLKDWRFNSDAPVANFPPPADAAEARAQDVEHLAMFFELERSWTDETLAAARQQYEQLRASAVDMSDAEFELAVARVVALAGNAHTKVREYNRTPRYSRLPIRGYWFADGYYIIRAHSGYEQYLGHRVVAIDGRSMAEVARHAAAGRVADPAPTTLVELAAAIDGFLTRTLG